MPTLRFCTGPLIMKKTLDLPVIGGTAYGFQMHHAFPAESTRGVGLYRLFCDTVRLQWILLACAAFFSGRSALAAQIAYLKLLMAGYGSQLGHYFAHFPANKRPFVVTVLQKMHLLLPSKHHSVHHRPPYNKHLTSVSGLTDVIMSRLLKNLQFIPSVTLWMFLSAFDVPIIEWLFGTPLLHGLV